ncbi:OmpA family protein [Diaphorobacter aerolatus]|uniref:OmpA family protein n=1 Tax=Diaphorobacter aerolatus TaxID=1288495 RepID=UPI001D012953|nr:OmpA family protein [Diaphorobacter aerolatus]
MTAQANGPFQIFFETGKSELGPEAQAEAKRAADFWNAHKDGKIALSGFVDSTGSADANAELAKKRAQAVAKVLTDNGVAADRIELRKPETVTAGVGDDRQARRVDVLAAQ